MNELIILKKLLNSLTDSQLADMELWVNNSVTTKFIAVDENAVTIVTDEQSVQIDGKEW